MNIVFLSPHFPSNYYLFCVHLKALGATVLGVGDAPFETLGTELKNALSEYYRVDSMENYDELLRACGHFTHIYGKLDRVESHNDYWQETEARLRTDFNIPGPKINQLAGLTLKSEMKRLFRNAGVSTAPGKLFTSIDSARQFIEEVGYPVVFKPDRGVGAANTFRVDSDRELKERLPCIHPEETYIMEAFVKGEIFSFDGLTDRDGEIVFFTAHQFSQGIMETVNEDLDLFYYSLREIPQRLERAGRNTVRTFDIRERFFHIEFFRTSEERYVGLEVNARPPGGLTLDMFNFANDIDLYHEWANLIMGNDFSTEYHRPYHCGYIGRKFNKNYLHSHRDIMENFSHLIVFNGPLASVFSAAIGNYAYLVNARTEAEIREAAEFIQATADYGSSHHED